MNQKAKLGSHIAYRGRGVGIWWVSSFLSRVWDSGSLYTSVRPSIGKVWPADLWVHSLKGGLERRENPRTEKVNWAETIAVSHQIFPN